jgi:hypothetical protein
MKFFRNLLMFLVVMLMGSGIAYAISFSDLTNGGSLTVGDKLFDNWSVDFYGAADFRDFDASNIEVTGIDDGGDYGVRFTVSNDELSVTGVDDYNFVDLALSFRVSVLDPMYKINGASLGGYGASYNYVLDGFNDNGSFLYETIGTGAGMADLGDMYAEFSVLDDVGTSSLTDLVLFDAQSEIWVSKNILVWATDSTDSAGLNGFEQRFSQAVIPEPSTFLLLGGGLAGLAFYARRRRKE